MRRILIAIFFILISITNHSYADNESKNISELTKKAEQGNPSAQSDLGFMYFDGKNIKKD